MIFNVSGGGGAALNFKVVGGTTQPSNPKENTIWVNTSQEITSLDFGVTAPCPRSVNKNLLCYPYFHTTQTRSGITWTDNGDGSISANGTATEDAVFRVSNSNRTVENHNYVRLKAGTYTLHGCPAGGSSDTYCVELYTAAGDHLGFDTGGGLTFTLASETLVRCNLIVRNGIAVSLKTFKPMLEKGNSASEFVAGDATGQVWISTGTSSTVELNALKKNAIQVYPIAAKQYIGGAWENKTAMSYQAGAWQSWVTDIIAYDGGATDVTLAYQNASDKGTYILLTINTNSNSASKAATIKTPAVNLTGLNVLEVTYSNLTGDSSFAGRIRAMVWDAEGSLIVAQSTVGSSASGTCTVDISGLEGDYVIGVYAYNTSGTYSGTCWVKQIKALMEA